MCRINLARYLTTATIDRRNVFRQVVNTIDPYPPTIDRWWLRARRASPTVTVVRRIFAETCSRRRLRSFTRLPTTNGRGINDDRLWLRNVGYKRCNQMFFNFDDRFGARLKTNHNTRLVGRRLSIIE